LIAPNSRRLVPKNEASQFFSMIIQKLANNRTIRFHFPSHTKEVQKKLNRLDIKGQGTKKWLWFGINSPQYQILVDILNAVSFTAFYAQVDGDKELPTTTDDLFNNLRQNYAVIAFS